METLCERTLCSSNEKQGRKLLPYFECLWEHSGCLSCVCIIMCAEFYCDAAENFVSPLSESSPSLRMHLKKIQCRRTIVSSSKRTFGNTSKFILPPLDLAFDRLKVNSNRLLARYHSCWRSWRYLFDWVARTTLYQVSQAQTAG